MPRRLNREKALFAQRAQHVKNLFQRLEMLCQSVNKEATGTPITAQRTLKSKNLGGIDVPDNGRLVLKFLERRIEVVINPLQSVGGRPAPIGEVATASVILYDADDPSGADCYDMVLREDGWHRRTESGKVGAPALAEKDLKRLIEWLLL
ncbi:MAG: hypothetical protein P8R42_26555 [Candidatus Binatia bacterium]|nr:hypothetical protein [Candidatus Binatia bacterium]